MTPHRPTPLRRAGVTTLLLAGLLAGCASTPPRDALYRAWGGTAGIRAVMDDFAARLQADARTARFFEKTDRVHLARQLTDQVCQATGGPCVYEGPSMAEAHAEMDITAADFEALVAVLQQSMAARGIPAAAQQAVLAALGPMQRDIVTRR